MLQQPRLVNRELDTKSRNEIPNTVMIAAAIYLHIQQRSDATASETHRPKTLCET